MKTIAFVMSLFLTSYAFAWGDREQGALVGIAVGALVAGANSRPAPSPPSGYYVTPHNRHLVPMANGGYYIPPAHEVRRHVTYCDSVPYYDQYGNVAYVQRCSNY